MPPLFPMQGRMGQQMMGARLGGGSPFMGMNRAAQFPMMGRAPQMNGGGGLLSRLLNRGAPAPTGGMNPFGGTNGLMGLQQAGRAAGGGGALTNSGVGGLSSFLNNTQQVLKTAQSIGPMVQQFQQYGSLIRNLPAMWRLFQGLKNSSSDSGEESASTSKSESKTSSNKGSDNTTESSSNQVNESSSLHKKEKVYSNKRKQAAGSKQIKKEKGASVPKLYI